jgi:putative transcriptional regulator
VKPPGKNAPNIVTFILDPNNPPRLTPGERKHLRNLTEAQIIAAAKSDPDNPPLTKAELKQFKPAVPPPNAKAIRKATGLSQTDFAWRFGFDVSALRDWEQGRRNPDRAARVLLAVIQYEPKAVDRALAAYALSPYQKKTRRKKG